MRWALHFNLVINRFKCKTQRMCFMIIIGDYFDFCGFRGMVLSLLHLVVDWEVFNINQYLRQKIMQRSARL